MRVILAFIYLSLLISCIGAGTHGSIKYYEFNTSKYNLEKAVQRVISENKTIEQDSVKDYYNDDTTYITIRILSGNNDDTYTFRYGGDKEYWDSSKVSSISIAYAHNKNNEGGSEGNGGIKWYNFKLKEELTKVFEEELISKIKRDLEVNHSAATAK
jgi:hypothetical protein